MRSELWRLLIYLVCTESLRDVDTIWELKYIYTLLMKYETNLLNQHRDLVSSAGIVHYLC